MKGIALITTLAMSVGTAAYAEPARAGDRDTVRVQWRDRDRGHDNDPNAQWSRDRYDSYARSHWARDFRGRWVTLARGYSSQTDRQMIELRGERRLSKLRIEGVRGAPLVQKIAIEFGDGSMQAVDLDMRLSRGTGEVIDLNGRTRNVRRIIVYTDPRIRGAYTLYGA